MVSADPPSGAHRARRWWRPVLAVVGLVLAAFFFLAYQRVLTIVQKPSWPPGPGAITAAGAQLATQRIGARRQQLGHEDCDQLFGGVDPE